MKPENISVFPMGEKNEAFAQYFVALFNAKDEWASDTPVAFELQSAEIKDGGSVWLRYLVKR